MTTFSPPAVTMGISVFGLPRGPVLDVELHVRAQGYGGLPEGYYGAWLSQPVEQAASLMLHTVIRPDQAVHARHQRTGETVFEDGYYAVGLGKIMLIRAKYSYNGFERYTPQLICDRPISPQHMKTAYERIL